MSKPKIRPYPKPALISLLDGDDVEGLATMIDTFAYEGIGGPVRYRTFRDRDKGKNFRFAYATWGDDPLPEYDHEVPCVEAGWAVQ